MCGAIGSTSCAKPPFTAYKADRQTTDPYTAAKEAAGLSGKADDKSVGDKSKAPAGQAAGYAPFSVGLVDTTA